MKSNWRFVCIISTSLIVIGFFIWITQNFGSGEKKNEVAQAQNEFSLSQRKQDDGVNLTFIEERNKMRISKVKETCKTLAHAQSNDYKPIVRVMMDQNHRIAYCRVNKAASTYTIAMLGRTFNRSPEELHSMSTEVRLIEFTKLRQMISDSYTFTFVREPYGRLFSTYSNKFYFPKNHWAPIGPTIVKRYRNRPSMDGLKYGHNITFHELIRYTVEEHEAGHVLDEHLRPMNVKCYPCDYRYDFIGKLETMESDWTYLKHVWHTKKNINMPKEAFEKPPNFHEMKHILDTFVIISDSTISRYKLYFRAWSYFQITGQIYKHVNMPFGENSDINYDDFLLELGAAAEKSKPYADDTKRQKVEAMKQAYASVPLELLERLSKVVALDCLLYGYDNKPDWVFDRNIEHSNSNYFKGLE